MPNSTSNPPFGGIEIPFEIRTSDNDPIEIFFDPLLKQASTYDVAVGYFSTAWIRDASAGVAALATNGGSSRWVISPTLSKDDWNAISQANTDEAREQFAQEFASRDIEQLQSALQLETRIALGWLIRDEIISFKIAIPQNELTGIFHAKFGLFTDVEGNEVAFSGSYNLTGAAATNWEVIEVYVGWESAERKRVTGKRAQFERIWSQRDPNLAIYKPNDGAVNKFIEITEHYPRPYRLRKHGGARTVPTVPPKFLGENGRLRDHQESAIREWFANNGRGIFELATGSGKTVTALATACKLFEFASRTAKPLLIMVTVPYKHLAEQWSDEASEFGFDPLICYEGASTWTPELRTRLLNLELGASKVEFIITVNATFSGDTLQSILQTVACTFLFISDEMHNMGALKLRRCLPEQAKFRLGLSATPIRHNDEVGTEALQRYFGKVVAEYTLADAIRDGTLTRYYYYPIMVEFTEDEMVAYRELSLRISKIYAQGIGGDESKEAQLERLLFERARMIGSAENKLPTLRRLLQSRSDSSYNLVYCGDAVVDGERSVDATMALLGTDLGMRARKFTSDESLQERRTILEQFGTGELQVIAAIRCLDEGVDVPRTETAYILASSGDPRQYVQRRGRVLRRAPGKKFAYIYDFIVVPPLGKKQNDESFNLERKLVQKEFIRVNEFASAAENAGDALLELRPIRIRLNLLDT